MSVQVDIQELVDASKFVMENAYAPYSNFKVGAAVLCDSGEIFCGCNVENASYGLSICAERTAIAKAVCSGERIIRAIAISSSSEEAAFPCGACRQVIAEFAPKDGTVEVYLASNKGIARYTLEELLPNAFTLKENH